LYKKDLEAIFGSNSTCLPTSIKMRGGVNVLRACTVTVSACWPTAVFPDEGPLRLDGVSSDEEIDRLMSVQD
jgi:hypothetical protein